MMVVITKDVTNFVQNAGVTMGVEMGVRVPAVNTETPDPDPVEAVVAEDIADLEVTAMATEEVAEAGVATDVRETILHPVGGIQTCRRPTNA